MLALVADAAPSLNETILLVCGVAWGIATSPLPLAALVAILLTPKPAKSALAFTVTWFVAIFVSLYAVSYVGESLTMLEPTQDQLHLALQICVFAGAVLLVTGITIWFLGRNKDRTQAQERARRLLDEAGDAGPRRAALFAMASVVINVSNYPYFITISLIMARGHVEGPTKLLTILIGSLVCSSTFIIITIIVFAWRDRVEGLLDKGRDRVIKSSGSVIPATLVMTGLVLMAIGLLKLK